MTDPKPRPWFRFHLSTAIVLMFVAGVLVWANVTGREDVRIESRTNFDPWRNYKVLVRYFRFGWPLTFHSGLEFLAEVPDTSAPFVYGSDDELDKTYILEIKNRPMGFRGQWHQKELIWNIAVALAILAAVGFALEWRVRRKKGN